MTNCGTTACDTGINAAGFGDHPGVSSWPAEADQVMYEVLTAFWGRTLSAVHFVSLLLTCFSVVLTANHIVHWM